MPLAKANVCSHKCRWNLLHTVIAFRAYYVQESGHILHQKPPESSISSPHSSAFSFILNISQWMVYYTHFQANAQGKEFCSFIVSTGDYCLPLCPTVFSSLLTLLYWLKLLRNRWVLVNRISQYLKISKHRLLQ